MAKEVNLKESFINSPNLNCQGLPSNGYFVLMCQKFLLNKTKKKFRHYHDFCLSCKVFGFLELLIPKALKELKTKRGGLKFDGDKTNSKSKEKEEDSPK